MLEGTRILDFSWVLAGPYATRILADFGADVIKVQSSKLARATEDNRSGYFHTWNRSKKSITLDVGHPDGRRLALALAAVSDVVVENFSPRVMSNWRLTYEDFRAVKPDVIMLSISAAGHTGPGRDWVGFAPTLHALSGLSYLTAFTEDEPLGPGVPYGDVVAGLYGALAVLAALEHRERTGQGQHIDLSQYEALCTVLGPPLIEAAVRGERGRPRGNGAGDVPAAPHGCYRCRGADRWCVIAVFDDEEWASLCRVMGDPPWTSAFASVAERRRGAAELDRRIGEWTVQHAAEDVVASLQDAGVAAGVVQDAAEVLGDPHLAAREFFVRLADPVFGEIVSDANPLRIDDARAPARRAAPGLGEHNEHVFRDVLGLPDSEWTEYLRNRVIG